MNLKNFVASYDLAAKTFKVNFAEAYSLDSDEYDIFHTGKKRSYAKEDISKKVKDVFDVIIASPLANEIMSLYLNAHFRMLKDSEYGDIDLVSDCESIVFLADQIGEDYINLVHTIKDDQKKRKNNIELQFTDEHDKLTLRVSFLIKLIIPLVSEYLFVKKIKDVENILLDCYGVCFLAVCAGTEVKLTNKLYKIAESRIKTTRYSDRTIWSFLSIRSINPTILADDFNRKIIIDIMPKLENNKRVISYLHVVLKNMLGFQFQFNFKDLYSSVDLHEVSDPQNDRLTNLERLEFHIGRIDESEAMIEEAIRNDIITVAIRNQKRPISPEELEYYKQKIQLNPIQTTLLFLHNAKVVGKINAMYGLRYAEYVALLVSFKKWLEDNGFVFLSKWITCTFAKGLQDSRKPINNKDFAQGLINSKAFKYLHDTKYAHVMPLLLKNNAIAKLISTIFVNEAQYTPTFEESTNLELISNMKGINDYNIAQVSDEIIRFLKTV